MAKYRPFSNLFSFKYPEIKFLELRCHFNQGARTKENKTMDQNDKTRTSGQRPWMVKLPLQKSIGFSHPL